jgi:hypothetical protein
MTKKKINQLNYHKKGIRLSSILSLLELGKSQKEIANELGCSEANISKRLKWAERHRFAVLQFNSYGNIWNTNPDDLTRIIADEVIVPKSGNIELHQFDAKLCLFYPQHVEILDEFFEFKYKAKKGKKWNPKRNQHIYSIPIYLKHLGYTVNLRKSKGSNSLVIQGVKAWGEDYCQARDRAILTCFSIIWPLATNLQIKFRMDNFEVTRTGDVAINPPTDSELKGITRNIVENVGNIRTGNLQIDDSNNNGGQIEIKTDYKNSDKRREALKDANNLATLIKNADVILAVPKKLDSIITLLTNLKITREIENTKSIKVSETINPTAPTSKYPRSN